MVLARNMQWSEIICFCAILISQCFSILLGERITTTSPDTKYDWDYLMFTQRWPITTCTQWEYVGKNNSCAFPNPTNLWTIHGIWPTKSGTKGPNNCNNTWHFNATQISPIQKQLEDYWINVEKNTKLMSLWKHEWSKHGTCAATLPQLNNEFKYFNQGLLWLQQYNMKFILSQSNISPNNKGYLIEDIFNAIKSILNVTPSIQCVVDRKTKQSLISEIRICFDKELKLIDCTTENQVDAEGILTNCNLKKVVMYPNSVAPYTTTPAPPTTTKTITSETSRGLLAILTLNSLIDTEKQLFTIYRTIKLLIWATI